MHTKLLFFAFLLSAAALPAQETQTLFQNTRVTGGFGGPIFSLSRTDGQTGYGAGGGGGVVFNQFYAGLFGMGETFGPIDFDVDRERLALGYGGLWLGYTTPTHKLVHLYTSVKIGGGAVGTTNFRDDWDFEPDWPEDVVFVAVPEAGLELNMARWLRLSGSVGYRFVGGFDGWQSFGKNDLNAPVYALTLRFGWFGKSRRAQPPQEQR